MNDWQNMDREQRQAAIRAAIEAGATSASDIACRIPGATRNAIIGQCHRARPPIRLRGTPYKHAPGKARRQMQPRQRKPKDATPPAALPRPAPRAIEPPGTAGIPFLDITEHTCKWPLWGELPASASEARHCGAPSEDGTPYCAFHNQRGTTKVAA